MISWVTAAVAGAAGLVVGDYFTVLIDRVPEATTVTGSFRELVPAPAGKCPRCDTRPVLRRAIREMAPGG
jgi:hypothetical protein